MSKKILLVDDDPNIRDTAKDILEDAGYLVEAVGSVAQAMQAFQGLPFQVIIADLNLPDGSGLDLASRVRQLFPTIRIILMTGQAEGSEPAGLAARQEGLVDHYLVKPVSPSQLLKIIESLP